MSPGLAPKVRRFNVWIICWSAGSSRTPERAIGVFAGVFAPDFCADTPTGATLRSIAATILISFVICMISLAAWCRVDAHVGWTLIPPVRDPREAPSETIRRSPAGLCDRRVELRQERLELVLKLRVRAVDVRQVAGARQPVKPVGGQGRAVRGHGAQRPLECVGRGCDLAGVALFHGSTNRGDQSRALGQKAVSYTHLTLPT